MIFRGKDNTDSGSIGNNGVGTAANFTSASDRRLKNNIRPMDSMLDKIMGLKPSVYNWISAPDFESDGFIAQEVFELLPRLRNKQHNADDNLDEPCDENGKPLYYGLDYGKFTPYIVKAMQEMKQDYDKKIADLESRLLALETKNP
jgi:hypothetical protein